MLSNDDQVVIAQVVELAHNSMIAAQDLLEQHNYTVFWKGENQYTRGGTSDRQREEAKRPVGRPRKPITRQHTVQPGFTPNDWARLVSAAGGDDNVVEYIRNAAISKANGDD